MTPKVNRRLLVKHVGDDSEALYEAVQAQLAAYPDRQKVLDGRPSVRLRQLKRLRDALKKTNAGARFLIEGLTTDPRGFPKPEIDFSDIEARIEEAISGLQMEIAGSAKKQRSTEVARDFTAQELAGLFKQHYQKEPKEYRLNLDAFLRGLFFANRVSYPDKHEDPKQRDAFLRSLRLI